jgi:hypothetical protein
LWVAARVRAAWITVFLRFAFPMCSPYNLTGDAAHHPV